MQKIKLFLITIFLSFAVIFISVEGWGFYGFLKKPISTGSEAKVIVIPQGSSARRVANILFENKMIREPTWFIWVLKHQDKAYLLRAGEFKIQPNWTVTELITHLAEGQTLQHPVTFIAGQTARQAVESLRMLDNIEHTLEGYDEDLIRELLGLEYRLEGQFLPETFYYQAGDKDIDILIRSHQALKRVLEEAWQNRHENLPIKTSYEALILASIVEKETGYAPERPIIAGVFMNRLNIGMRLQSDPTIIYGMGDSFDGNIRRRDIHAKTLFNTYVIPRLPPTPIALSSADAILAVTQPAITAAFYFVAKGGGKHQFSDTYAEHNKAIRKYILNKH